MNEKTVVETVYGKHHKYEVVRLSTFWSGPKFVIYRDGVRWRGQYNSLARAVEVARQAG